MSAAKILIVDDEPDIVKALGMRLRWAGYDVISATDGVTATQLAVRQIPDLIVLDIGLPGGDGHTVAQRLNDNVKTVTIPVIYLTARNDKEDVARASALGAFDFMTKPFDPEKLLATVKKVLEGNQMMAAR